MDNLDEMKDYIRSVGQEVAEHLPKIYGKVELIIQGGHLVRANMIMGVKPESKKQQEGRPEEA